MIANPEIEHELAAFFRDCEEADRIPTVSEIALRLGTDRHTLLAGQDGVLALAVGRCEAALVGEAMEGRVPANLAIFILKAEFGWKDEQTIKVVDEEVPGEPKTVEEAWRLLEDLREPRR